MKPRNSNNIDKTQDVADEVKDNNSSYKPKPFVKDNSDNKVFKDYQIDDITPLITDDCIGIMDSDTMVYEACSNQERRFITITHKEEGWSEELAGVEVFRGKGKGIKPDSWLGRKNLERDVEGLEPYTLEDFEVEAGHVLKVSEDKAIKDIKIQIFTKLKTIRLQYNIPRIKVVLGEGRCFRNDLPLCREYKGKRKETLRPILLSKIRKWVIESGEIDSELAPKGIEADDLVENYSNIGYTNYRHTGKFNYILIASDKDAMNNPKILVNPDTHSGEKNPLRGKFKFPKAMLIEATDRSYGDIEIIQKEKSTDFKFIGFKGLLWQAFLSGDSADNYNCLSHLQQGLNFGDESAYRLLKPCTSAKESLQEVINKFAELLPYGVQYTDFNGVEHDVDTITYMNSYFLTAYMQKKPNDDMDFFKLCKLFKVDTSSIENNNVWSAPVEQFNIEVSETLINDIKVQLSSVLNQTLTGYSAEKKDLLKGRLDESKDLVKNLLQYIEDYSTISVQVNKETNEIRKVN